MNGREGLNYLFLKERFYVNDIYSVITGLAMHAYSVAGFLCIVSIPASMLIRAFYGKSPL